MVPDGRRWGSLSLSLSLAGLADGDRRWRTLGGGVEVWFDCLGGSGASEERRNRKWRRVAARGSIVLAVGGWSARAACDSQRQGRFWGSMVRAQVLVVGLA